jgi:hypothetical protein
MLISTITRSPRLREKKACLRGKKRPEEHKDIMTSNGALTTRSELNVFLKKSFRLRSAAWLEKAHRHDKRVRFAQTTCRLANLSATHHRPRAVQRNLHIQENTLGLSNSCSLELHYKQPYRNIIHYSEIEKSKSEKRIWEKEE